MDELRAWLDALEFRDPAFLALLALAPVAGLLARRRRAHVRYPSTASLTDLPRRWRARLTFLPALAVALATACLALALAGPRTGDASSRVRTEGIAIMLVVDRSGSMEARDFVAEDRGISRLDAVKAVIEAFVLGGGSTPGRPNDQIGLVVFGTYADGVAPLTLDHGLLVDALMDVEVATRQSERGTAIGEGLALAVERLDRSDAASRVVILLTDGVNSAGEIDPLKAADLAADSGVRVYTIGAGTNGIAPVPVVGREGRVYLRRQRVTIDEGTLQEMAERADGLYFNARDADGLAESYASIDALERSALNDVRYLRFDEHFPWLIAVAIVLLLTGETARLTVLRQLP